MDSRRLASVGLALLVPLLLCTACDNDELTESAALHAFGTAGEPPEDTYSPPEDTYSPPEDTWYDSGSGLTWQVTPTGGAMNWDDAKSHCSKLGLAGGGWRLPDIGELRSLIRGCPGTITGGACEVTDSCLSSDCWDEGACWSCSYGDGPGDEGMYWPDEVEGNCCWYWSSSPVGVSDYHAWGVYFPSGGVDYDGVYDDFLVRCVR